MWFWNVSSFALSFTSFLSIFTFAFAEREKKERKNDLLLNMFDFLANNAVILDLVSV